MSERLPPTEAVDASTRELDRMPTGQLVAALARAQRRAIEAAETAAPSITRAVDEIAARLRAGGTLHYVGAGTSGRLGFLDAAEIPPTFGTPRSLVRAHVAGGREALVRAIEGAEDDRAAARELASCFASGDAVVGISASGGAPYVVAALELARVKGAFAIALTADGASALARSCDLAVVLETGAEPIAGSTRLVAGTAQKIALNLISTATMVRLEKVHGNLMVDVVATNEKLRRRAVGLVTELARVDEDRALAALGVSEWHVKTAVVMLRRGIDRAGAQRLLDGSGGSLRRALEG